MAELSIKIKIGDREYPMKVSDADEQKVRRAGKLINERLRTYSARFGLHDKQDLLAMVAFDCLVDTMNTDTPSSVLDDTVDSKIDQLNTLLNQALQ
jgi:cell division protein ZapA